MFIPVSDFQIKRMKIRVRKLSLKKIIAKLGIGLSLATFSANLAVNIDHIAKNYQLPKEARVFQTDAILAERLALLNEVLEYIQSPEYKSFIIEQERRHREIELELAAAKRLEEKEDRYNAALADSIVLETPAGTTVYAFGRKGDNISVSCESTEFGSIATIASSYDPTLFFSARFLDGCTSGTLKPGDEIGQTLGSLGWSQHSQTNGIAEEPAQEIVNWALSGYAGETEAPFTDREIAARDVLEGAMQTIREWIDR